jgi:hypothetical protein
MLPRRRSTWIPESRVLREYIRLQVGRQVYPHALHIERPFAAHR